MIHGQLKMIDPKPYPSIPIVGRPRKMSNANTPKHVPKHVPEYTPEDTMEVEESHVVLPRLVFVYGITYQGTCSDAVVSALKRSKKYRKLANDRVLVREDYTYELEVLTNIHGIILVDATEISPVGAPITSCSHRFTQTVMDDFVADNCEAVSFLEEMYSYLESKLPANNPAELQIGWCVYVKDM